MIGPFVETEPPVQSVKASKILQRKQIQKRLQGLKPTQYQKIIQNLTSQNQKLRTQVKSINQKVEELMQSRKIVKNKNPQIEQEILRLKKQLDLKYESMNYLKQALKKHSQGETTQEMRLKIQERSNVIMQYEMEFKELQKEREKITIQIKKNQEDINEFMPTDTSEGKLESLKNENKDLKQKISQLKEYLTNQERQSKGVLGKLYQLKDSQKKEKELVKSNKQISASLKEIKTSSLSEITELEREIENLKIKKKEKEKDLVTDRIIKESKRSKMEKQIRNLLQLHKELYKKRVKGVNQLNFYEQREVQLEQQLIREAEAAKVAHQEVQVQTVKIVPLEFRKEWIGKSQGLAFNDANVIQFRGESLIKAVTVYKTPENIVWTKFHYQSPERKKYQSEPPFDKFILKKCEAKRYQSKSISPLSGLIVSVHAPSNKIVRIELKWADGDTAVIGWDMQGSTKYPFDINDHERPVCMFGSIQSIGKFSYVLESLGCQINAVDD